MGLPVGLLPVILPKDPKTGRPMGETIIENIRDTPKKPPGFGDPGSGGGFSPISEAEKIRQANLLRKLQAEARAREIADRNLSRSKQQKAQQIEKERRNKIFLANKKYQNDLKKIHNQAERIARNNQLQREIANIQAEARVERVERGIIQKSSLQSTTGKVSFTAGTANRIRKAFGLKPGESMVINPKNQTPISIRDTKGQFFPGVTLGTKGGFVYVPIQRKLIPRSSIENIGNGNKNFQIKTNQGGKIITLPPGLNLNDVTRGGTKKDTKKEIPQSAFFDPTDLTLEGVFRDPEEKGILNDLSLVINKSTDQKFQITQQKGAKPLRELQLVGLGLAGAITSSIIGFRDLPKNVKLLAKNPKLAMRLPGLVLKSIRGFGDILFISGGLAIGRIAGELVVLKGTSKVFKQVAKLGSIASARISPKFVGSGKVGSSLNITTKAGKKLKINVVGKIGSKALKKESISKQLGRAGKKIKIATSTQADNLITFIRNRTRTIRKPIPNEDTFSKLTKKLLSQFDEGTINKKNLIKLDKLIKKQSGKGLLERSFFADPKGRIRPSRLGGEGKEANLLDVLSGDVSFRTPKPQILVFTNFRVQKFPKALKSIVSKLRRGKALTKAEADKFLRFQLKKSGKFKALGFASGESEITIAPGEIIKRIKKLGVTIINGKKVSIVQAKILKPTGKLKTLLTKFNRVKKLSSKEMKELNKLFKKATGTKLSVSSAKVSVKRVPISRLGLSGLKRGLSRVKISRRSVSRKRISRRKGSSKVSRRKVSKSRKSKPSRKRSPSRTSKPRKPSRTSRRGKPSRKGRSGSPSRPARVPKKPTPIITSTNELFKKKKLSKKVPVFLVKVKRRGRIVNLVNKPLKLNHAKDYLAFHVDHNLVRSGWFLPLGKAKKVAVPGKKIMGYFNKVKHKLRPFKIRSKQRKKILNGYIEKRKFLLDKAKEKRQLKALKKRKVKRVVRKGNQKRNGKRIKRRIVKRKPIKRKRIVVKRRPVKKRVVKRKVIKRKQIKKRRVKKRVIRRRKPIKRRPVKGRVVRRKPTRKRKPQRRKNIKRRKR